MSTGSREWLTIGIAVVAFLSLVSAGIGSSAAGSSAARNACQTFGADGPRMFLPADEQTTIEGSLAESATGNLAVVLRFPGQQSDTILRNESVHRDGEDWSATFDLSAFEDGRTFVATLERDGYVIEAIDGEIGSPSASVTFTNQSAVIDPNGSPKESYVFLRRVHLDQGGFVAIHENIPSGPIIGLSYYLESGTHENVTARFVELPSGPTQLVAMPHFDSDCDETFDFLLGMGDDGPYVDVNQSGRAVTDNATVVFPTPSPTPTATPTPTPTPTPLSTPTSTPSPTPTGTQTATPTSSTTPATTPGFGLGVTLLAGGTTAILYRRTRRGDR